MLSYFLSVLGHAGSEWKESLVAFSENGNSSEEADCLTSYRPEKKTTHGRERLKECTYTEAYVLKIRSIQ